MHLQKNLQNSTYLNEFHIDCRIMEWISRDSTVQGSYEPTNQEKF